MLSKFAKKQFFGSIQPSATQLLIDGKFVNSSDGRTFDTVNPATEETIVKIQHASAQDVDRAVQAARRAFDNGPWRRMSPVERGNCMFRLHDLMVKHRDELARLESLDNGKPLSASANIDIPFATRIFQYYAGWCDKIHGQTMNIPGPFHCYTRQEPVGVVGAVIPWNFPLLMVSWKLGPALATGCTIVLKPAEQTPLTALRLGELITEAGFPEGVVNILPGEGDTGKHLVNHPDIDKVAFTGSTSVGMEIVRNSAAHNLKRLTLELGGKSPNIIMDDADIDFAIRQASHGVFFNQGQCCIAGSRVFVHERIYDEFVARSAELAKQTVVGDPFSESTQQGPQVDVNQHNQILKYIDLGNQEGAKLLAGGGRHGTKGYFVQPTVFADVNDNMTIAKEEIFGPVMSILKFKTLDEVIARANNSNYGLGAGVVTNNIENYLRLANEIRTGTVYVNCYDVFDAAAPFGGFKDSGLGRELGEASLKNYLETKTVIVKTSDETLP